MKDIIQFINEELNESLRSEDMFITAIKYNKFTKEQLVNMLMNMDMKVIKDISNRLKNLYSDDYFIYEPSKDDFLKNSEKENICGKISDFLLKYVCK